MEKFKSTNLLIYNYNNLFEKDLSPLLNYTKNKIIYKYIYQKNIFSIEKEEVFNKDKHEYLSVAPYYHRLKGTSQ